MKVDSDGLMSRIDVLPSMPSSYYHLTSVGDRLFYMRHGLRDAKDRLMAFDLDKRHETELGEVAGYEISAEGSKMLVHAEKSYAITELPLAKLEIVGGLDLSGMKVDLDRAAEWRQIFRECWRQMRDFVYDPNMQGVDWRKNRERYEQLLPYVNHRADLTYVIGEMIGELNLGHYLRGRRRLSPPAAGGRRACWEPRSNATRPRAVSISCGSSAARTGNPSSARR